MKTSVPIQININLDDDRIQEIIDKALRNNEYEKVVRCQECKHYRLSNCRNWCDMFDGGHYYPNPNDYCSLGVRVEVKRKSNF